MSNGTAKGKKGSGSGTGCLVALVVAILAGVALAGFFILIVAAGGTKVKGDKIAHIDLEGIITSSAEIGWAGSSESMVDRISEHLKEAREDDTVKAIVLRINSPGGEVTASDVLYHRLKKTADIKPVVVYMDSTAASGGYYIACGAHEIIANKTTLTGSIGVIIQTLNYEQLFDKIGLRSVVFTSGRYKDMLSGARPMSDEEAEIIQQLVDQIYGRFLEVVKEGRDLEGDEFKDNIANGRVFTGQEAVDRKLVDSTGYIEDAYDRARDLAGAPDAKVVRYTDEVTIFDALGLMKARAAHSKSNTQRLEVDLTNGVLPPLKPGMMYYLPSYYSW